MKVQTINTQCVSHKAYFKPNKDLQKLVENSKIDKKTMELADKLLNEMPNHALELIDYSVSHNPHFYYPQIHNITTGRRTTVIRLFAREKENHLNQILSYILEPEKKYFWSETTEAAFFNKITKQEY